MTSFDERLGALRGKNSGGSFDDRLNALRQPSGASGGWEDSPNAVIRFGKGLFSQLDPRRLGDMAGEYVAEAKKAGLTDPRAIVGSALARFGKDLIDTRETFTKAANEFALAIPGGSVEPSVMDDRSRIEHAAEGAQLAVRSIPVAGPIVGAVADDVIDSLGSGDLAGAAGKLTGAAALAKGPKVAKPIANAVRGRGAAMAANAERAYAGAFGGGPLTESMAPKMMERGIRPSDPAALVRGADEAAAGLTTEAAALDAAREATRGRRGAAGMRRAIDAERGAVIDEIEFQGDLKTIAERLPESKSVRNILTDTAKRVGASVAASAASHAFGMPTWATAAIGGAGSVPAILKGLNEIRKTPAFVASTASAKRSFAKALAESDVSGAAKLGAEIISGNLIADEFGHVAAMRALAADTGKYDKPELRRQAATQYAAYYVGPDGKETSVPRNVMTATVGAPNVSEIASPLSSWLLAMAKQRRIKSGGRVEFRDRNGQVLSGTLTE